MLSFIMITNDNIKVCKMETLECIKCNYKTNQLSHWKKHIETKKHKQNPSDMSQDIKKYECECGKSYTQRSNLSRHKKTCKLKETTHVSDEEAKLVLKQLGCQAGYDENEEFVVVPKGLFKKMVEKTVEPKTVVNEFGDVSITNINVFLNEKCSNALSIQEFAKNLIMSLEDLEGKKTESLVNVIIKNLQPLSITERPFHCTNANKKEWFIKDQENGWEEDNGMRVLSSGEYGIIRKWPSKFVEEHPNWQEVEKLQDKYIKISGNANSTLLPRQASKALMEISNEVLLNSKIIEDKI